MSVASLGARTSGLLLSRGLTYGLTLVNSVLVARTLGPERLGAYGYAMATAAVFGLLPNMGISTVVTRNIARGERDGRAMLRTALGAQVLVSSLVFLLILAFARVLPRQPVGVGLVALAAGQLTLGALSWPYLAVLAGHARFRKVALVELLAGIAGTAAVVAVALGSPTVTGFLWAQVAASGVAVAVARLVVRAVLPTHQGEAPGLLGLLRRSAPFGLTAAVQSAYTRVDYILLGQISTLVGVGLYQVAYKPTNVIVYFGATIAGTLFPVLARPPYDETPGAFRKALRGLGILAPAMVLGVAGLARPLLVLVYGDSYAPAAPLFVLLAGSAAFNWLYSPLAMALQARDREVTWLLALAAALILNATANLWAIPRYGAAGAALTTLASEALLLCTGAWVLRRALATMADRRKIGAVLAGAAAGAGLLVWLAPLGEIVSSGAALAGYAAVLFATGVVGLRELRTVSRWLLDSVRPLDPSTGEGT